MTGSFELDNGRILNLRQVELVTPLFNRQGIMPTKPRSPKQEYAVFGDSHRTFRDFCDSWYESIEDAEAKWKRELETYQTSMDNYLAEEPVITYEILMLSGNKYISARNPLEEGI